MSTAQVARRAWSVVYGVFHGLVFPVWRGMRPRPRPGSHVPAGPLSRIYMGAGRIGGTKPEELVGAITTLAGIRDDQVGAIEIADRFSIVELPESLVDRVVHAMRKARLNGRKMAVRRFIDK